ncbi:MAG: biotin-dependent carboxyltransferase family protein [Bacteroidota bacterium]
MIEVRKPGLFTTIQDLGRTGYRKYGIPWSGVMDKYSALMANSLVKNKPDASIIEITHSGPELWFEDRASIALVGAEAEAKLNGHSISMNACHNVSSESLLSIGALSEGCRLYLAVNGGIEARSHFGSSSTYISAKLGGIHGDKLKKGDLLKIDSNFWTDKYCTLPEHLIKHFNSRSIRFTTGPEWDKLKVKQKEAFEKMKFKVSPESNRMGIRLQGELTNKINSQIISSTVFPGTVQLPPGGFPIISMNDGQTTGGYWRIASVISIDLDYLAQQSPGNTVTFKKVEMDEAIELMRYQEKLLLEQLR